MCKKVVHVAVLAVAITNAMLVGANAQTAGRGNAESVPPQKQERCLRALDGSCTNPRVVEAARLRAIIIPSIRVSYYGTSAGTIGGQYIPYERFFRDNPILFALPTNIYALPCCITRSK